MKIPYGQFDCLNLSVAVGIKGHVLSVSSRSIHWRWRNIVAVSSVEAMLLIMRVAISTIIPLIVSRTMGLGMLVLVDREGRNGLIGVAIVVDTSHVF